MNTNINMTNQSEQNTGSRWIDLHTHTTASDGTFTPDEVVKEAATLGLGIPGAARRPQLKDDRASAKVRIPDYGRGIV